MNEIRAINPGLCDRCDSPLGDQLYQVKIEADPPLTNPIALAICEHCMESMTRWMHRRPGGPGNRHGGMARRASRESRHRKSRRSNRFADVLDRDEVWSRRKNRILIGGMLAVLAVVLGLTYFAVINDVIKALRER